MIRISIIIMSGLFVAACGSTEETSTTTASNQPWGEDEGDLICEYEATVGSRIGKRTCRTQEQIDAQREAGQDAVERWGKELDPLTKVN